MPGRASSTWRSASRARAAPRAASAAAARALEAETLGYTMALGNDALRARIAMLLQRMVWRRRRARTHRRDGRIVGGVRARLPRHVRRRRRGGAALPGLSLLPAHSDRARAAVGAAGDGSRPAEWMPTADDVVRAVRRDGIKGLLIASPANPDGHDDLARSAWPSWSRSAAQHGVRLISDEIYHGLTYERAAQTALGAWRRRHRHQQLLEVLLDDRLARRLDGAAASRWCAAIERLCAEPLHLAAGDRAGGGAGRVRCRRGAGSEQARLCRQPRALAGGAAEGRLYVVRAADGAFYLYCDVSDITGDAAALARTPAAGDGRRGDARHRFRRRSAATVSCGSPTRERRPTWPRRRGASRLGRSVAGNPFLTSRATPGDGLPLAAAFLCPTAAHQMTRLRNGSRSETHEQSVTCARRHADGRDHPGHHRAGAAGDPRRSSRRPRRARRSRGPSPETIARLQDGRVAMAKAALKLSPDQETLWAPVEAKIRAGFEERRKAAKPGRQSARSAAPRRPRVRRQEGRASWRCRSASRSAASV